MLLTGVPREGFLYVVSVCSSVVSLRIRMRFLDRQLLLGTFSMWVADLSNVLFLGWEHSECGSPTSDFFSLFNLRSEPVFLAKGFCMLCLYYCCCVTYQCFVQRVVYVASFCKVSVDGSSAILARTDVVLLWT